MVTDIAHELRTPLTNIRGYLEAVRDGVVAARPDVIDSLYEESLLLSRLVEDLQELALAEAGQLRLRRRPTAIGEIAERTLAGLPPQAAGGPALRLELPTDLPLVDADPERVGQVQRNLVTNAQHYTSPEGSITINAQVYENEVKITVCDTGTGIAPDHLPYVFERFYRADQARARSTGSAGATFIFTLPRA